MNNIEWHGGIIIIYFPHSNGYQEGVNRNEPWNIYSNPLHPEIFPLLALDKYVLEYPTFLKGDCHFPLGIQNKIV